MIAAKYFEIVPHTAKGQFLQKIHTIIPVELRHEAQDTEVNGELGIVNCEW
jgi:hypothetical protein